LGKGEIMNLSKWPIFKAGIFRQAKYLVSAPQKAQRVLEILEDGTIGIELLPMQTGFLQATTPEVKKAWAMVHALKLQVCKNGQPLEGETVLVISERSYIPLDPLNILKEKDREKLASLKDIAKVRHAQARAAAGSQDKNKDLAAFIIQAGFVILGLFGILAFFRGC
jgi:hypothetical protein